MTITDVLTRSEPGRTVCAGIIGLGDFATAIVGQSRTIPALDVAVGADADPEAGRAAFLAAGYAADDIVICDSLPAALLAMERGLRVVLADPMLLMELPLDVVVEATGDAEAGAAYAADAIGHGKHVAMVNKEADCVVGPILKQRADAEGVVYTAVEGDQHGLLMNMVAWARAIGLDVICGGKFCDSEIRYDPATGALTAQGETVRLNPADAAHFRPMEGRGDAGFVAARAGILGERSRLGEFDYEELAIMSNATGLLPDTEALHHPTVRLAEVPGVLCPVDEGGLLERAGAIDAVVELRDTGAPGLGGGVFIVVRCANAYARETVLMKGDLPTNAARTAALIYRPYHFCGVEATLSILVAGLASVATGASEYAPRVDVAARARRDLSSGDVVTLEDVDVGLLPARPVGGDAPLPLRLALANALATSTPRGALITAAAVVRPSDSFLWALRAEQDRRFLSAA